ncbi:ketosteroid isomerase-like protein [Haloactinopolyspora alba]|uniref:Ketosteroid isomerase-like protein n=1 Tax=Haloactinopolyspora alba TaxID=648780 RepID=A0A2P8DT92_9ACTN|nr:nuclear transport factor 2 family protein [Haloactinopolyspora alba]PSL00434.1 ketosteroid isomerase-like protein [Haloactinopolyspora alba]
MTSTSQATALDTVLDYHRTWTGGDIDRAMTKLADDFVCHAPGEELTGKDAYRRYLAGFVPNLTGLTDIASFADGDHVALFYYPQTAATRTAVAAEYFTVRDGIITESVLVFDRLSYAPPSP